MSDAILLLAAVVFFLHRFFHKTGEEIVLKLSVLLSAASIAIRSEEHTSEL